MERLLKRQDVPKPSYLINTSPNKWQVVWKVDGFGKDQAEELQQGLARDTGADPAATDCARVLRLPGFRNHKYGHPYMIGVKTVSGETNHSSQFPEVSNTERLRRDGGKQMRRTHAHSSQGHAECQVDKVFSHRSRTVDR